MPGIKHPSGQPPTSPKGHPLPRRSSPETSVTLRHHRLARQASERAASSRAAAVASSGSSSSARRQSSGESHNTGPSDPKTWFDQNNENPTADYSNAMDVDPPFFQKESDSSNEDQAKPTSSYPQHLLKPPVTGNLKPSATHSSSADDYRSVIDDLTIEIKKLKDELKRHKQNGPQMMKRDKLFEIKVHGLPKRKKRELESTLREFAAGLESSTPSAEASSARKKSRHTTRLDSGSGSMSKHASSSSGSHSRPVDSAYASMSTGANSSGTSLARPSISSRARSSEQKVQNYLKDIPEGLYPRHMVMTDKDKKKLIVRRLEQIFTGRIAGRNLTRSQPKSAANIAQMAPIMVEPATGHTTTNHGPTNSLTTMNEPSREARILASEEKRGQFKDNNSATNSNEQPENSNDQPDSGGNSAVTQNSTSPPNAPPPEQRPTRPRDLDPDRLQNPTENMDYIRHLGLAPPHLTGLATYDDVSPDADGWVYLNLLCNMAQLHMLNVAPDYIRSAVSERSTKFQLSPDGRKIRWRGGTEGTRFSSDSSGDTSQMSRSDESEEAEADGQRKKRKVTQSKSGHYSASSGEHTSDQSKLGQQVSSADGFHYKPMFLHQSSSAEQTSLDDTGSSFGAGGEDSNNGESRWGNSGSGSLRRKRKRLDGAIIYYSGAPFCTDLSGDPGDASPSSYITSTGQEQQQSTSTGFLRPEPPHRTASGSALPYRPLSDGRHVPSVAVTTEETDSDEMSVEIEADFPWSDATQHTPESTLDACGMGGVVPDDHFMVVATTKRAKKDTPATSCKLRPEDVPVLVQRITSPLNSSSDEKPLQPQTTKALPRSHIHYTARVIKKLNPAPLPPPGMFFAFDSDSDDSESSDLDSDMDAESRPPTGNRVFPHNFENTYPEDEEMTSGDEEGEEPDDGDEPSEEAEDDSSEEIKIPIQRDARRTSSSSAVAAAGTVRGRSKSLSAELPAATGSSVATAGGAESGYSSGREESG
ncbi:frequency clock protein [Colletotrichum chrysophilum]|uniref:Frequency clock protein n=1 Tax=Colletotrichum chrysophilum TaxID=1836956 RepID=A0AAD9AWZ6_9PEZI|nr:frequency clock protein [Colletotrichum chrysophilum]